MQLSRTCATALVLGALLASFAPPAQAAPGQLVIAGSRSSVLDVTFTQSLALRDMDVDISGGGAWSGLVIEPLDARAASSRLIALRHRSVTGDAPMVSWGMAQFPAGSYRIRLLTDAAVRITLHVDRGDRLIRPVRPIATTARSGVASVAAGSSDAAVVLGRGVPPGRRALLLSTVSGLRSEDTRACATTGRSCYRPVVPAALPSPLPAWPDPMPVPVGSSDGPSLHVDSSTARVSRSAVLTVRGLRAEAGTLRLFCLAYD